jgi:hypothetical protein
MKFRADRKPVRRLPPLVLRVFWQKFNAKTHGWSGPVVNHGPYEFYIGLRLVGSAVFILRSSLIACLGLRPSWRFWRELLKVRLIPD